MKGWMVDWLIAIYLFAVIILGLDVIWGLLNWILFNG